MISLDCKTAGLDLRHATEDYHPAMVYCRISTPKQSSRSFVRQQGVCERFGEKYGYTIAKVFQEIGRGYNSLPVRERCVKEAEELSALIITESWDRYSRNLKENLHCTPSLVCVFEFEEGLYLPYGLTFSGWNCLCGEVPDWVKDFPREEWGEVICQRSFGCSVEQAIKEGYVTL